MNDVDRLIENTSVDRVLTHFGKSLPDKSAGEFRMNCVFNEACSESSYGQLTVKLDDPINRIYCHSCGVRGNLLTLIHGLKTRRAPDGGKLRGPEFKEAVAELREIAGSDSVKRIPPQREVKPVESIVESPPRLINIPLARHEKEAARNLANLHEDLIVDVAQMSPEAAAYVRKRPWMTPEIMRKWGVGWIPGNGRSLFRKHYLVYTHRNERGDVVSYSGRDLCFEKKWTKWIRDGKPDHKKPFKHRYVQGYHRGIEIYGGQASRLNERFVRESLDKWGVVVVEGMNDVIRLEELGVAAVGLGSNKATAHQINKVIRFARDAASNRVTLFPDCDGEGEAGFKSLLWDLTASGVQCRLGICQTRLDNIQIGFQPEDLTRSDLFAAWKRIASTETRCI